MPFGCRRSFEYVPFHPEARERGSGTTALQSKADSIRGTYNAAINDPAMRATHGAELSSAEAAVKASRANGGKVKWTGRSTGGLYGLGGGFLADKLLSGYLQ